MFEVGDEVYFESKDESGNNTYIKGIGVINSIDYYVQMYNIETTSKSECQVATESNDRYKHDVIRKLTKLDKALK